MIDVDRDLDEGVRATKTAKHFFDIEVDFLASATQKFKALNAGDAAAVKR